VENTVTHLRQLGLRDAALEELARRATRSRTEEPTRGLLCQ
jgi:cation transport regulator ChaC